MSAFLRFTAEIPSVPGLFFRNDGELLLVSVEEHFNGRRNIWATIVTPDWVPAKPQHQTKFLLEADQRLGGDVPTFLGPIKLNDMPRVSELQRDEPQQPAEPGLFFMSRNVGHTWLTTVVSVSIHRFTKRIRVPDTDELFGLALPSLEDVPVEAGRNCIFTLALPRTERLDLERLQCATVPVSSGTALREPPRH